MTRYPELKIKICSLADEAHRIRREEKNFPGQSTKRAELHNHRVCEVRTAARHAQLAYGFLRERAYKTLENKCRRKPSIDAILKNVRRFEPVFETEDGWEMIRNWLKGSLVSQTQKVSTT